MLEEPEGNITETLERALDLVRKRRRWIFLPACTIALGTIAFVLMLPDRYSSEATLVMQQQVLQRYVLPVTGTSNAEAIQAMTRQVLSRTHLVGIINQFGLYPDAKNVTVERLAELMRDDISIQSLDPRTQTDFNAFRISFTADSPQVAQMVASRLTQLFIDENLKTRQDQAASTANFLNEQLQVARLKLAEQEQRLRDFKTRNLGELPEQQGVNLGTLTDLRGQLQNSLSNLSRAQLQRATLESSLNGRVARLQADRATLLTLYTPRHPEVLKKDQEIARMEAVLNRLKGETPGADQSQSAPATDDHALAELIRQVEANRREIEDLSKDETRIRAEIGRIQSRLNLTPVRDQELSGILRDYDLFKQQYTDLLNKQLQSQLATSLEESRGGVQFRLVDPPSLPVLPSSPKRMKISLGGAAAGLFLGIALAFLIESRDRSFH